MTHHPSALFSSPIHYYHIFQFQVYDNVAWYVQGKSRSYRLFARSQWLSLGPEFLVVFSPHVRDFASLGQRFYANGREWQENKRHFEHGNTWTSDDITNGLGMMHTYLREMYNKQRWL
jgi:hypothetical protein